MKKQTTITIATADETNVNIFFSVSVICEDFKWGRFSNG